MKRTVHTMTAPFRRARFLVVAIAAAAMLVGPTAANAQPKDPDPGVRCAAKIGPGEYEFYLPGAKATDVNGDKWVCGPDGNWFRDYSSIRANRIPVYQVVSARLG